MTPAYLEAAIDTMLILSVLALVCIPAWRICRHLRRARVIRRRLR